MTQENKSFGGNKPYLDLTPERLWNGKLNAIVENHVRDRVNGCCEFCLAGPKNVGVFGKKAHKFSFEKRFSTINGGIELKLERLIHLCNICFYAIHIRQAGSKGNIWNYNNAIERLCAFHSKTEKEIQEENNREYLIWENREKMGYPKKVDISILDHGIDCLWSQ